MSYQRIANKALGDTRSILDEASDSAKQAKKNMQRVDEINAFLSLQAIRNKNFKDFEKRYNSVFENAKISGMIDNTKLPSARDVFNKNERIPINDKFSMHFEELESLKLLYAMNDPEVKKAMSDILNYGEEDKGVQDGTKWSYW